MFVRSMFVSLLVLSGSVMADPQAKILEQFDELKRQHLESKGVLDASVAGLRPDAEGDQTKKLEQLITRVAEDDQLQTLFIPKGDYLIKGCLLYTSPSPRDRTRSRMPSSA